MKRIFAVLGITAVSLVLLLTGCDTRSISDSGYSRGFYRPVNPSYHGELSEFDVLGVEHNKEISEKEINVALDSAKRVRLKKNSPVLLIQSGAYLPDQPMLTEMNKSFSIVPFTGQPDSTNRQNFNKSLRLAAARAGCGTIVCYWGTLESASKDNGGKVISWVPVVGGIFPDETKQMRISLKMALVDVRNGDWAVFAPEPYQTKMLTAGFNREAADQSQVQQLKEKAYVGAVKDLVKIYAD